MRIERMIIVRGLNLRMTIETNDTESHSCLSRDHEEVKVIVDNLATEAQQQFKQYREYIREKYGR